ncbi:MAG: VOC family protein [Synechococcales cyanobacterium CRU_2_2]|nr:VOC family protein [Synechococcales cyanobacterium CRU_2_2]
MAFEFDHLFICTDPGAEAADRLAALGLVEGSANVHPGQGTRNRRFFFQNAMVELLWVDHPAEAQSAQIQRTHLWERWRDRRSPLVCPFGICLRPMPNCMDKTAFSSWAYRPPYLPEPLSIAVGTNSHVLGEPMLFQTPFGKRPDQQPLEKSQPLAHPLGLCEITRVELISPIAHSPSTELLAVLDTQRVSLRWGAVYSVEIGFDYEQQGKSLDLRSELPLTLRW